MITTYYVALQTGQTVPEQEYTEKASLLLSMLKTVFDAENLDVVSGAYTSASVDVEIRLGDEGLVGDAVVDYEHEGRVTMDKGKLSVMLKGDASFADVFPALKIVKKQVK